jgi:hypothetical protein
MDGRRPRQPPDEVVHVRTGGTTEDYYVAIAPALGSAGGDYESSVKVERNASASLCATGVMGSQRRRCIALFALAFGLNGCKSKHRRTEPERNWDVQVPLPASAQVGDGAWPDAGKDCAARKHIKQGSPMHPPLGQIIPGDGIQSDCLGDPVGSEIISSAMAVSRVASGAAAV